MEFICSACDYWLCGDSKLLIGVKVSMNNCFCGDLSKVYITSCPMKTRTGVCVVLLVMEIMYLLSVKMYKAVSKQLEHKDSL